VGILLVAGLWHGAIALTMPCISRDSVTFCWYARDLGEQGLAHLRGENAAQHPLMPAAVLAAQRLARCCGAPDTPMTWQRSGQAVSWLAGMAVVVLAGAITHRFVRRLELPIDTGLAACAAMVLAMVLPLNVWLSAEIMSDELHLALYLWGAWTLLRLDSVRAAATCGVAGGLAFLTRPEGIVVALAGLAGMVPDRATPWRRRGVRAAALLAGFLVCAVPYWSVVGTLSSKKNPLDWLKSSDVALELPAEAPLLAADETAFDAPASATVSLARLDTQKRGWYALVPYALYQLFRAGRVVIPLLAIGPLLNLRRRLLWPPLAGVSACIAGHFTLTLLLLHRYHYLGQRHMLVIVMLLVPPAAVLLARLVSLARERRSVGWLAPVILAVLSLAAYALPVPNRSARYLATAADWLRQHDPDIATKRIMTASSERRIVFYTDARWVYWYDLPGDTVLPRELLLGERPDYLALSVGEGFEVAGNDAVAELLHSDPEIAPHVQLLHTWPASEKSTLQLYALDWSEP
jgi:hypothetical protein